MSFLAKIPLLDKVCWEVPFDLTFMSELYKTYDIRPFVELIPDQVNTHSMKTYITDEILSKILATFSNLNWLIVCTLIIGLLVCIGITLLVIVLVNQKKTQKMLRQVLQNQHGQTPDQDETDDGHQQPKP